METTTPPPEKKVLEEHVITATTTPEAEVVPTGVISKKSFDTESWKPITKIGKLVKAGQIKDFGSILDQGHKILESEIADVLITNLESDLLAIGQSKGKFGGGKRSVWRQTQKKTPEGNKPSFATLVVIGNKDGYVGIGFGKAKETVPAREKATRNAKLNIIKIRRGCGSWDCHCGSPHSIPYTVIGKCGSVIIELMPAPKGTGLCIEKECKKIIALSGIKDIYSRTFGHTNTKLNLVKACFIALRQLTAMRVKPSYHQEAGIIEGSRQ